MKFNNQRVECSRTCAVHAARRARLRALGTVVRHVARTDWPAGVGSTTARSTVQAVRVAADHAVRTQPVGL